jgi:hypothetical protein
MVSPAKSDALFVTIMIAVTYGILMWRIADIPPNSNGWESGAFHRSVKPASDLNRETEPRMEHGKNPAGPTAGIKTT